MCGNLAAQGYFAAVDQEFARRNPLADRLGAPQPVAHHQAPLKRVTVVIAPAKAAVQVHEHKRRRGVRGVEGPQHVSIHAHLQILPLFNFHNERRQKTKQHNVVVVLVALPHLIRRRRVDVRPDVLVGAVPHDSCDVPERRRLRHPDLGWEVAINDAVQIVVGRDREAALLGEEQQGGAELRVRVVGVPRRREGRSAQRAQAQLVQEVRHIFGALGQVQQQIVQVIKIRSRRF